LDIKSVRLIKLQLVYIIYIYRKTSQNQVHYCTSARIGISNQTFEFKR